MANARLNREPATPAGFRLFLNWLDEGEESHGQKYLEMRRRLVTYFDRKHCAEPDELADETLNRVARRLEEEGAITGSAPAQYCYVTAKFVFLEYLRSAPRANTSIAEMSPGEVDSILATVPAAADDEAGTKERLSTCLDDCLATLAAGDRTLILEYYQGEQRTKIEARRGLAATLSLSVNALSIRACRVRNKLETCVRACAANK